MNKCERCKQLVSEVLVESAWEDDTYVCKDCYEETEQETYDYMSDMDYACLNGCCACCGCSCF